MFDTNKSKGILSLLLLFSILSAIVLAVRQETRKAEFTFERDRRKKDSIGIVEIYGPITSAQRSSGFGTPIGTDKILKTLKRYREEDKVKGVLIRLNSPGGTVGAVQEITREIERIREAGKPVVATIKDVGASGGYYIASVCDKIIVNPGSIIGSIGVIFMSSNMSGLLDTIGVEFETVKSGPYKDAGSFHRAFEEDEIEFLDRIITDTYQQFVTTVSEGRELKENNVKELAQGQIYSGSQARELKLVDILGDEVTARDTIKELAEVKDPHFIEPDQPRWYNLITMMDSQFSFINLGLNQIRGLSYLYIP